MENLAAYARDDHVEARRGWGRPARAGPERAQRRFGELDAVRFVALAATFEVSFEGDRRANDVRGALQRTEAVVGERRELVPEEIELQLERPSIGALRGRVPEYVVAGGAIPSAAGLPLRNPATGPAAQLVPGRVHTRLPVQVAEDARSLEVREAPLDEEAVRRLVVRGDRCAARARPFAWRSARASRGAEHADPADADRKRKNTLHGSFS